MVGEKDYREGKRPAVENYEREGKRISKNLA